MSEAVWWVSKDGDVTAYRMYRRHYSSEKNKKPKIKQFVGPGEKLVLRTWTCDALFVWRRFIDDSGMQGVNCAVFRNEGPYVASELIRQADAIADIGWPGMRHYTYVDPKKIRSTNPGFCFKKAGWKHVATTIKRRLMIFVREPPRGN